VFASATQFGLTQVLGPDMRVQRDFFARPMWEQETICENSWCPACAEADIGMLDPAEFEEGGRVFVEGRCARCGGSIRTELTESRASE